uniref:KOW domain-containing protein n=1 Tax=Hemiselmis tepida TaxID=464990 RepID=A0A7S0VT24_9CRYP|mmetsp:Transcript_2673/g.6812  ORF Transcript_2673/g.6812 Transcript_2673/m.6812 type:complete len:247 (+) Transcript_2673:2-742(+)
MNLMKPAPHRLEAARRGGGRVKKPSELPKVFNVWKIVAGDKVAVISGKEKGKEGKIVRVIRHQHRVIVEGLNLVKKHVKKSGSEPGRVVSQESPIHYSNVMLLDPVTGAPTKVKMGYLEDGSKVRISKKSGAIIPKPDRGGSAEEPPYGPDKDTPGDVVQQATVSAEDAELHAKLKALTISGTITSPVRLRQMVREADREQYVGIKAKWAAELRRFGRDQKLKGLKEAVETLKARRAQVAKANEKP